MTISPELLEALTMNEPVPFIVITNDNGRIRVESVPPKEFAIRCGAGVYRHSTFLSYIPAQDETGWVNAPRNSVVVLSGFFRLRLKDISVIN
jgi:hypothetical protein